MENQNQGISKTASTELTKLSISKIIREQPDKTETNKFIARLLQRLGKLYQIPNWSEENAVMLAQWIVDSYPFESLDSIQECLYTPPKTGQKNWRLTPDTIQEWMALQLEKEAIKREKEHNKVKLGESMQPINLPDFDQLFKGTWYTEAKREVEFNQERYDQVKQELYDKRSSTVQDQTISESGEDRENV